MIAPETGHIWLERGNTLTACSRYDDALAAYDQALTLQPDLAEAWVGRGNALYYLLRYVEALAGYSRALAIRPNLSNAFLGCGHVFTELARYKEALEAYDNALTWKADLTEAWLGRGRVLRAARRHDEALAAYDQALKLEPDFAGAWLGRGNVLGELKRHGEALVAYDKALSLRPDLAGALLGRGNACAALNRPAEATVAFQEALAKEPGLAEAWLGVGNVLTKLGRHGEAVAAYDQALRIRPDFGEAYFGRGNATYSLKDYEEAAAAYATALSLNQNLRYARAASLDSRLHICAWATFDDDCSRVIASVRNETDFADPFAFLSLSHSPADQLKCAQFFCLDQFPLGDAPRRRGHPYSHDRIRVAYISADFRDHAVSYLLAGLFEQHDRRLFETVAVSLFPGRQGEMRTRLEGAFGRYIDASNGSDMDAYHVLRELEVDIAVDLTGHTAGSRPGIFTSRPAPIQVSYLGYPGTTGAGCMDYIIADRFVIPEDQQKHYSEKVVLLPETFQANDSKRQFGHGHLSRAEAGLPDGGFVFCSFNGNHKIAPPIFNVWMRLLSGVENSVLWLHIPNARAEHNLRCEAYARGIEPARIIAAPTLGYSEHLARYRLGELFLDTFPFNAGATASDALWSGLPLVTCSGDAFASRMAGSLLHAIGLPELITQSLEEYEALALKLAHDPLLLASIKGKLARNRDAYPLFKTERITRHIEVAYTSMWERDQRGEAPASFSVELIN